MNVNDMSIAQLDKAIQGIANLYSISSNWAVFSGEVTAYFYDLSDLNDETRRMRSVPINADKITNEFDGDVKKFFATYINGFLAQEYGKPRRIFDRKSLTIRDRYFAWLRRYFLNKGFKETTVGDVFRVSKGLNESYEVKFDPKLFETDSKDLFDKVTHKIVNRYNKGERVIYISLGGQKDGTRS